MAYPKTYKANGTVYEIPEKEAQSFLKDFPTAVEVITYKKGKDKYDIPVSDTSDFVKENPDAELAFKHIYEGSHKVKNTLSKRYGIKTIPSQSYLTISFAEPGKKHNLFTHLLSKIFKK